MPRESPAVSENVSADEEELKKTDAKASKADADEGSAAETAEGDSEEGNEEEYEIEEILQAKKGVFGGGKLAYFVKWKGYGPEENSWVNEEDAGNATDLISKFWKGQSKKGEKKTSRKSTDTPKRPRKSTADASDGESAHTSKKRGRKSQTKELNGDAEGEETRPAKKHKKSKAEADNASARTSSPVVLPEEEEIGNMASYMNVADWSHLVNRIDTVEQKDGELLVYFTLTDTNERVVEKSEVCRKKFPQKMLDFYEKNLRWRESNSDD